MKVINMTPHAITVDNGNEVKVYEPSGTVARVTMVKDTVGEIDGFEVVVNSAIGDNLPNPEEGTYLIVSAMVLAQLPHRKDLIAPNTNEAKRNEKGHIISVPGFVRA